MPNVFIGQGNLLPNRDFDQHEVLPYFALNQTGLNGQLVTFVTGAQDPINSEGYTSQAVAASYSNIYSTRYVVNRRVRPATFGDTRWEVAGITLYTTALSDENGNLLLNMPDAVAEARSFVKTGQAVPILKRGQLTAALSQFNGTIPTAGYPLVASGTNGGWACIPPSVATGSALSFQVVGRCISSTGTYNGAGTLGGFAQIEIAV
jgi:hypothetical protein